MSTWTREQLDEIEAAQEVQVVTRREDGASRRPVTTWIVRDADRVFLRSTKGRAGSWFRGATAVTAGQVVVGGNSYDVTFEPAADADLDAVDAGYRAKYGNYASIVDHLNEPAQREATLQVRAD